MSSVYSFKATLSLSLQIVKIIHPIANLPLGSTHRVTQIQFHPTQPFIALQSHDRSVEVFRIRTEEELKKKMTRRKKRAKEKKEKEGVSKKTESMDVDEESTEIPFIDRFTPHVVIRATGKIRSFDFSPEAPNAKAAAQVGNDQPLQGILGSQNVLRYSWPSARMLSKSTTSLQNQKKKPSKLRAPTLFIFPVTALTFALCV